LEYASYATTMTKYDLPPSVGRNLYYNQKLHKYTAKNQTKQIEKNLNFIVCLINHPV